MSSETERITNEFLNRHHLGKPVERLGGAYLQDAESSVTVDEPTHTDGASVETDEPARDTLL